MLLFETCSSRFCHRCIRYFSPHYMQTAFCALIRSEHLRLSIELGIAQRLVQFTTIYRFADVHWCARLISVLAPSPVVFSTRPNKGLFQQIFTWWLIKGTFGLYCHMRVVVSLFETQVKVQALNPLPFIFHSLEMITSTEIRLFHRTFVYGNSQVTTCILLNQIYRYFHSMAFDIQFEANTKHPHSLFWAFYYTIHLIFVLCSLSTLAGHPEYWRRADVVTFQCTISNFYNMEF